MASRSGLPSIYSNVVTVYIYIYIYIQSQQHCALFSSSCMFMNVHITIRQLLLVGGHTRPIYIIWCFTASVNRGYYNPRWVWYIHNTSVPISSKHKAPRIYKTTIDLEVCFPGGNVSFQLRCYLKLDPNIQLLQGTNQQSRVRRPFPPFSVKTIYQLELSLKLVTCSWKINIGPQRFSSSKQTRSW